MTIWCERVIRCPGCGTAQTAQIARGANAGRDPHLRDEVLGRRLHRVACACGLEIRVEATFEYLDIERRQLLLVGRADSLESWPELEAQLRTIVRGALERGSPLLQPFVRDVRSRVVLGAEALREKLVVWEAALDDALVECIKLRAFAADPALAAPGAGWSSTPSAPMTRSRAGGRRAPTRRPRGGSSCRPAGCATHTATAARSRRGFQSCSAADSSMSAASCPLRHPRVEEDRVTSHARKRAVLARDARMLIAGRYVEAERRRCPPTTCPQPPGHRRPRRPPLCHRMRPLHRHRRTRACRRPHHSHPRRRRSRQRLRNNSHTHIRLNGSWSAVGGRGRQRTAMRGLSHGAANCRVVCCLPGGKPMRAAKIIISQIIDRSHTLVELDVGMEGRVAKDWYAALVDEQGHLITEWVQLERVLRDTSEVIIPVGYETIDRVSRRVALVAELPQ